MNRYFKIIALSLLPMLGACNDDIFIDDMELSVDNQLVDWTGGPATITVSGQNFDSVILTMGRKVDGKFEELAEIPLNFVMSEANTDDTFQNVLFSCRAKLDLPSNRLTFEVAHNYYPDTVFIGARVFSEYDNRDEVVAVLPSPGFEHGKISYILYSWMNEEKREAASFYAVINSSDRPYTHTVLRRGQKVAGRMGWFEAYNKLLSDNIFGLDKLELPTVKYDADRYMHSADGQPLVYSSEKQAIDGYDLLCDKDEVIEIAPNSVCHITIWVQTEGQGFQYSLPAYNPLDKSDVIDIQGKYWVSVPLSYQIETQIDAL